MPLGTQFEMLVGTPVGRHWDTIWDADREADRDAWDARPSVLRSGGQGSWVDNAQTTGASDRGTPHSVYFLFN